MTGFGRFPDRDPLPFPGPAPSPPPPPLQAELERVTLARASIVEMLFTAQQLEAMLRNLPRQSGIEQVFARQSEDGSAAVEAVVKRGEVCLP